MAVPTPRATPYRIAVVCLGNICRSPMAAIVLRHELERAGLDGAVEVTSAGTGDWHMGDAIDERAAEALAGIGLESDGHRAQQFEESWFDRDLVLAMDARNYADIRALGGDDDRVRMFRSFDPEGAPDAEVPDPFFGGPQGFDEVLAIVTRTSRALVADLAEVL